MLHDSTPPLLRGLGTTLILVATILSFTIARQEMKAGDLARVRPITIAPAAPARADEADEESVIEEVLSNPWIESLSCLGTGLIAASFYAEWRLRRSKAPAA